MSNAKNKDQSSELIETASKTILEIESEFRKPGSKIWNSLYISPEIVGANNEPTKEAEQANEGLKNTLLQALQMQHLVLLAGSGCSLNAGGPSMEDLWNAVVGNPPSNEIEKIAKSMHFNLDDKNIEKFLSTVESFLSIKEDMTLRTFLNEAQKRILDKCSDFLSTAKISSHETLLHRLSRRRTRDQRLRVFTTNYDLCFERAASGIGCVAIDGFTFIAPRQYDPRYFDYDIIRRPRLGDDNGNFLEGVFLLYKLHGSVNWERTENGIFEIEKPDPQKACLIYPASGKYQQSYSQPYIESIAQYLASIREPNTCVLVIGFGFNDDHLSGPLLYAVQSNPHLRLIIVDPYIKAKDTEGANQHVEKLFELSSDGEDVWFINETFDNFAKRIPNLKSLSPAERLLKEVKGAIQQP